MEEEWKVIIQVQDRIQRLDKLVSELSNMKAFMQNGTTFIKEAKECLQRSINREKQDLSNLNNSNPFKNWTSSSTLDSFTQHSSISSNRVQSQGNQSIISKQKVPLQQSQIQLQPQQPPQPRQQPQSQQPQSQQPQSQQPPQPRQHVFIPNEKNIYFYWNDTDLSCISGLVNDFKSIYSSTKRISFDYSSSLDKPCILFIFIAVSSRIDQELWPKKTKYWSALAYGNSVVVRVHHKESNSYDDDSMDSLLYSRPKVLKAKFDLQFHNNGISTFEKQVLLEPDTLKKEMILLING